MNYIFKTPKLLVIVIFFIAITYENSVYGHVSKDVLSYINEVQLTVNGLVTSENGDPIPGVNVMIKGTSKGVLTDFDGNYTINVSNSNATLVFSYIGFTSQEIVVGNQKTIKVTLKEDVSQLDEVVVVGYGTQKKANLTSAVSTVSSEALENRPVTNLTSALQGTTPGLNISRSSGQPGEEGLNIQIRGISSANGAVNPLVIVDGVPSSTSALNQTLNPEDVESVTVLKDAAAASIYGSQAAGGVILVTTKSGKSGKTVVSYSGQIAGSKPVNMPERLSLLDEANYSNLARENAGIGPEYNDQAIQNIINGVEYEVSDSNPNNYIYYNQSQDVRDIVLRDVSLQLTHNLKVSGGSEDIKYLFSLGYLDQDGVFKIGPDKFKRYTSRLNLNANLNKYLNLDSRVSYAVHNRDQPSQSNSGNNYGLFQYLQTVRQRYPVFTPEGRLASGANTYALLTEGGYKDKEINELDGILTLTAKNFIKGLEIRTIYGRKFRAYDNETFNRTVTLWGAFDPIRYLNNPNSFSLYKETIETQNFQFLTDYDLSLNKHNFHILAGYQWEDYRLSGVNTYASSLVSNDLPTLNTGARESYNNTQNIRTYAAQSFLSRFSYNYDGKYLFEATIRSDETSRLAPDSRVNWFPALSFAWNIHKENWFSDTLPFISQFKPRFSWGQLGNANGNIIGYYDYLSTLSSGSGLVLGASENRTTYFYQNGVPSSTLAWETIETINYGIDLSLFKNRLQTSFDYYIKKNKNMLIPLDLPATFGVNTPRVNNGELKSWGWELDVKYNDRIGENFNWNLGFNLSDNQNELINYGEGRDVVRLGTNNLIQGYPISTIWGYETKDGYIETQEQLDAAPFYSNKTGIGDIEYIDQNGDGLINQGSGTTEDPGDLVNLGSTNPRYLFGITGGAQWKNIDFSFFFQGAADRSYAPNRQAIQPYASSWLSAQKHQADYWTPDNPNAAYPRPFYQGSHNFATSDRWVLNGNYIRLKNIQLGYSLSPSTIKQIGLNQLRFYVSGQDILTFSKLGVFDGVFDPEQNNGIRSSYPVFAYVSFGINISF
ncbi:TonB-dependent receptor [Joostella atrarenae]|uniref:TonB-dependent receptor n=1 Tax=Joostella atrarenae TaxID=679257 RepID=A0ABS9J5B9_9FLAO|nr:TonB-dependent receptor [Joostella atrarenae]MCF8715614.1 TonB-dependent receptor [Joostella atrarenae]